MTVSAHLVGLLVSIQGSPQATTWQAFEPSGEQGQRLSAQLLAFAGVLPAAQRAVFESDILSGKIGFRIRGNTIGYDSQRAASAPWTGEFDVQGRVRTFSCGSNSVSGQLNYSYEQCKEVARRTLSYLESQGYDFRVETIKLLGASLRIEFRPNLADFQLARTVGTIAAEINKSDGTIAEWTGPTEYNLPKINEPLAIPRHDFESLRNAGALLYCSASPFAEAMISEQYVFRIPNFERTTRNWMTSMHQESVASGWGHTFLQVRAVCTSNRNRFQYVWVDSVSGQVVAHQVTDQSEIIEGVLGLQLDKGKASSGVTLEASIIEWTIVNSDLSLSRLMLTSIGKPPDFLATHQVLLLAQGRAIKFEADPRLEVLRRSGSDKFYKLTATPFTKLNLIPIQGSVESR